MKKGGAERVFTAGWHAVGLVSPSCLLPVLPYNSSCMPSLVLPMRHDVPCATADLAALPVTGRERWNQPPSFQSDPCLHPKCRSKFVSSCSFTVRTGCKT